MMRVPGELALVFMLACTSAAPEASPGPGATCEARVAAMRSMFAGGGPTDRAIINLPDGMEIPASSGGVDVGDGIPLFVRADGTYKFDNQAIVEAGAVQELLKEEFEKAVMLAENTGRPFQASVLLVIDRRAPLAAVRDLVQPLPPGGSYVQVVELAGDPVPPPPPIPAWLTELVAAKEMPYDEWSTRVSAAISRAIGTCAAVREALDAADRTPGEDRRRVAAERVPAAVLACGCDTVDVEALTAILWKIEGKHTPSRRQLPLGLTGDEQVEAVTLPVNATGSDLARLAEERGARPFRLTLAPAG
jgi:hypothetical protein